MIRLSLLLKVPYYKKKKREYTLNDKVAIGETLVMDSDVALAANLDLGLPFSYNRTDSVCKPNTWHFNFLSHPR